MDFLLQVYARFAADEGGSSAIEYAIILGLMVIGIVAALSGIGTATNDVFTDANAGFPG